MFLPHALQREPHHPTTRRYERLAVVYQFLFLAPLCRAPGSAEGGGAEPRTAPAGLDSSRGASGGGGGGGSRGSRGTGGPGGGAARAQGTAVARRVAGGTGHTSLKNESSLV